MSLINRRRETLKLDQKFITPFLHAVRTVFTTMVQIDVNAQPPQVLKTLLAPGDVFSLMPMRGQEIEGQLILSFPEKTLIAVASKMLMEEFSSLEPIVRDSAGEICNIITGSAKTELSGHGYEFDMAQPKNFTAKDVAKNTLFGAPRIVVPYETAYGKFFADVGFEFCA